MTWLWKMSFPYKDEREISVVQIECWSVSQWSVSMERVSALNRKEFIFLFKWLEGTYRDA